MDSQTNHHIFESYIFYQYEIFGEPLSWKRVERCFRPTPQDRLSNLVFYRANTQSASSQYEELSYILRQQVCRLISEKQELAPLMKWTPVACTYFNDRVSHARDYLSIIILGRPIGTETDKRTLMGDFVDLGPNFSDHEDLGSGARVEDCQLNDVDHEDLDSNDFVHEGCVHEGCVHEDCVHEDGVHEDGAHEDCAHEDCELNDYDHDLE